MWQLIDYLNWHIRSCEPGKGLIDLGISSLQMGMHKSITLAICFIRDWYNLEATGLVWLLKLTLTGWKLEDSTVSYEYLTPDEVYFLENRFDY